MTTVKESIFRMYDIRGIYGEDLTDEACLEIGKGLGTFFLENSQNKVFVGRDNRISGESVYKSLTSGLISTGCNVVNLGVVINPLVYFSWHHLDSNACVIITASHNPPQYNGFKCSLNKKPLVQEDYQRIKEICLKKTYAQGKGKVTSVSVWENYKKMILSSIHLNRKIKIAIDCGNGTTSLYAPELFTSLGCEVIPLFCESDGTFPNHTPYPQKTEFYEVLKKTVKKEKCDCGIAFDGDGDRIGIYDENGNFVENDRLAMIFAREICQNNPGTRIVMNISTSLSVIEYIKSCGGDFIIWKTGYPFISEKMKEVNALFGGEISGHFFFRDKYFGYDDALYAATRILEILSNTPHTLSQLVQKLPKYYETREFRVPVPENSDKFEIIEKIKTNIISKFPEAEIIDFDGIRFSFPYGWGLIRASNTEPLITGRAEAKTPEKLEEIKNLIKNLLFEQKVILDWEKI